MSAIVDVSNDPETDATLAAFMADYEDRKFEAELRKIDNLVERFEKIHAILSRARPDLCPPWPGEESAK